MPGSLWTAGDPHVSHVENGAIVDRLRPGSNDDWLLAAGDVGAMFGGDGVRFEEVPLGYPREWGRRDGEQNPIRRILGPRA